MSMHVIIGKGNIGLDLYKQIKSLGHKARIMTKSDGFEWPESLPAIMVLQPDYIWVCAGAGSISEAKHDFHNSMNTHAIMPIEICQRVPEQVKVIMFSSDYAADEDHPDQPHLINEKPKSLYALSKVTLEKSFKLLNRPNACVIRVGTVYGAHFIEKCLPGKLKNKFPVPCKVDLPMNVVVPTPSVWIAETLLRNIDRLFVKPGQIHHVAPTGKVTVHSWGKMILGEKYQVDSKGFDPERPLCSNLQNSLDPQAPDWKDLWELSDWWADPVPKDNHEDVL